MQGKKAKVLFFPVTMKLFWELYPELEERTQYALTTVVKNLEERFNVILAPLVRDEAEAEKAAEDFKNTDADVVVIWESGYVASGIPQKIINGTKALPIVLFITQRDESVPDNMDYAKYMESTALTSAMELGGALKRVGKPYSSIIGHMDDQSVYDELEKICRAATVLNAMGKMTMGNIGYPYPGMLDIALDEAALSELDISMKRITLLEVENKLNLVGQDELEQFIEEVKSECDYERIKEADFRRSCKLYKALEQIVIENQLNALTVHDYECLSVTSETISDFALSYLENRYGISTGVEGDVPNCVSAYVARVLSGQSPMFVDWTMIDEKDNALFLQHNGKADPAILSKPVLSPSAEPFGGVVGDGVVFEAVGKPGAVTLVSMIYRKDGWHIFACEGEAMQKEASPCRLNQITVRFDMPVKQLAQKVCNLGLGHHVNVAYGHFAEEVKLFADMANIQFDTL